MLRYLYERPIIDGVVKFWMWCPDIVSLREHISMMIPNPQHFSPYGFKVRLYVPLGHTVGTMPPISLPNFCVPYSVDISSLGEYSQKMIFGLKSYDEMTKIYSTLANKRDSSLALFKSPVTTKQKEKEKGFYGEQWYSPKGRTAEEKAFSLKFKVFSKYGILSSPNFSLTLEKQLQDNYRAQKEISILYTGFIDDIFIRNFLFINFVETLKEITAKQKCVFRNVLLVNEAQNIFKKTHGTSQTDLVKILNDLFADLSTITRHVNLDLVFDSKPHVLPRSLKHNFQHHILTQIGSEDFDEYFASHPFGRDHMWKIMNSPSYVKEYGFLRLQDSSIPRFVENGVWKSGYRLPFSHRSKYGEADIDQWIDRGRYDIKFSFLNLKEGDTINFDEEIKLLVGDWKAEEGVIDEKLAKEKAKTEKKLVKKVRRVEKPRRDPITPEILERVRELRAEGHSNFAISKQLNLNFQEVNNEIRLMKREESKAAEVA